MMCGTPVAAVRRGAVPEILDDSITGCYAEPGEDFVKAVQRALTLDRRRVRDRAAARFSPGRMVEQYIHVYEQVLRRGEIR
jgi:glycosyltransferase involved in cell wall biosynthesis